MPVTVQHWNTIAFLHWAVEPHDLAPLLPDTLSPLLYDGLAWVGVTPFFIRVRPGAVPLVMPGCAFPETNVRTYVAGPDGRQGLWFLRMEVSAWWFVAALRTVGLPYVRRRMSVTVDDERRVTYRSAPRPRSAAGGHHIVVRPGQLLDPPTGGPHERFLTARWGAYHRRGPVLLYTPVAHEPWSLRSAAVETCEVDALFRAAGLPSPLTPPVAHISSGVRATIGPSRFAAVTDGPDG